MEGMNKLVVNDETLFKMLAHYMNKELFNQTVPLIVVTHVQRVLGAPNTPASTAIEFKFEDE